MTECEVCGHTRAPDLRMSLIRWKRPIGEPEYQHGIRCRNETACRERVAAQGREWPLAGRDR